MRREAERNKTGILLRRGAALFAGRERNKMEHVLLRSFVLTISNQVESGGRVAARFGKAGGYKKPRSELERGFRRAWIPLRAAPRRERIRPVLNSIAGFFRLVNICRAFARLSAPKSAALSRFMFWQG